MESKNANVLIRNDALKLYERAIDTRLINASEWIEKGKSLINSEKHKEALKPLIRQ